VLVRRDGFVKVLDFGLAKLTEPAAMASTADSAGPTVPFAARTEAGVVMGTVAYMSPEQAAGKVVDARSDVFAFCARFGRHPGLCKRRSTSSATQGTRKRSPRLSAQ
jgi:serine/threonine protein kinase